MRSALAIEDHGNREHRGPDPVLPGLRELNYRRQMTDSASRKFVSRAPAFYFVRVQFLRHALKVRPCHLAVAHQPCAPSFVGRDCSVSEKQSSLRIIFKSLHQTNNIVDMHSNVAHLLGLYRNIRSGHQYLDTLQVGTRLVWSVN